MKNIHEKLKQFKNNSKDVRFVELCQGDPRVNIQNYKGKAKAYQVKQVLKAIERLEVEHGT